MSTGTSIINTISLYLDFSLHWHVWRTSFKLTSMKQGLMLKLVKINCDTNLLARAYTISQLDRYVGICIWLRRKFGLKDTCFIKSLLQCRIFREAGFDAKINFGTRKATQEELPQLDGWSTVGHCWVTLNGQNPSYDFPFVFQYP